MGEGWVVGWWGKYAANDLRKRAPLLRKLVFAFGN
jgi:hypothetical protein